jgi:hypothetical protein
VHFKLGVWIIFYADIGLKLKHMDKARSSCPGAVIFHLRDGLAAGAFTGAAEVGGALPKGYNCFELRTLEVSTAALPH